MATSKIKFSPSVNIIRDSNYLINYIPTPNAVQSFNTILNNAITGIKSHVLIGSFGTGKSSFLLAFKQTLEGNKVHFKGFDKLIKQVPKYEFFPVIGEFLSLESYFAKEFNLGKGYTANDVIKALDKHFKSIKKKGKGLAIIVDEFGKFLEFAAKNNPESELYFIQLLAEWVNDSDNDTLLITTLHQDFSAYALHLNKLQRQEWDKVKGRLKDVAFNEPVEQLLYLASERINEKFPSKSFDKNFDKLFDCIKEAKAFPLKDYLEKEFAQKLYPFDILSAAVLTLALQKYGQNERSLFSFIESNDHLGINEFSSKNKTYFSISQVYDYLLNGYYSFLTTKYNPHYTQWSAIRKAQERLEGLFTDTLSQKQAGDLVKLIGLLNIFSPASAKLERRFYYNYAKLAMGLKNPEGLLKELESKKIVRYVNHSLRYILFEGTDLDIELAIDDAGRLIEKLTNVVDHLNQYFEFPFIAAKSVYYEIGTPRFFQFKLTDEPIKLIPEGEVDGFINLLFSEDSKIIKKIEDISSKCEEAILYGYYKNTADIKTILFEIQKIKKVIENNQDDRTAIKLLNEELSIKIKLLNHYVFDNLYTDKGTITWFFKGKKIKLNSRQHFNQQLSKICEEIYPYTPIYKNELINKTKISGQIATARKRLIEKLLSQVQEENLGFKESEFPPEKSIYLTLLRSTGIHQALEGVGVLEKPIDSSFTELWDACAQFMLSTKGKERNLEELISLLSKRPFKLKQGFIDYWVPVFLLVNNDEYALFESGSYIPELTSDILELINKRPSFFQLKAFDVAGVKLQLFNRYRVLLNQVEHQKPTNKTFIQTIKPFLIFYKDLPEYSKKTNRLDKKTIALRQVIASAKDPEKAFFNDFPTALGYSLQELQKSPIQAEAFIKDMQEAIRELRTSFDAVVDRFENYLTKELIGSSSPFPDYKQDIKARFKKLKAHLLLNHQKSFYTRVQSTLDDRKAWLNSIAQSCIGKPLTSITDEEEKLLYDKLKDLVYELDNLCEISQADINEDNEEVLKLEVTSFVQGLNKNLIRIPKTKTKEVDNKVTEIKGILGADKKINVTILAKLLQELLNHE
ncbi:hypothetical protein HB364_04705 [Pseudoflavitalea sp. X16]|uniref:hypothetical protein n=1 Tax=Paraflavitalea devenefica TaxID=2716334 RepID=UPI00141F00BB|nr:hypothetical protein [Paraflavitalea devenefica]NII24363.1 hypothetical protein [Paraflavitalea devenefica]